MRLGLNYPEDSMAKFTLADGTDIEAFTAEEVESAGDAVKAGICDLMCVALVGLLAVML